MTLASPWRRAAGDIVLSLMFCTRLPLAPAAPVASGDFARAAWAMPVAGAVVGAFGSLAFAMSARLGLAPPVAAALALAATLAATGCLHEDGLADTADSFGGADRARKLEIMRDSRLGSYGACALVVSLLLRWSAVASIADSGMVALALVASHAAARAPLPGFMALIPPARSDGLAGTAGVPPRAAAVVAALIGAVVLVLCIGPVAAMIAVALLAAASAVIAGVCVQAVGGHTGDVLGALEQVNEVLILLVAAAVAAKGTGA
jgi:adenosylcobinamide-GDP ribazoletransferase